MTIVKVKVLCNNVKYVLYEEITTANYVQTVYNNVACSFRKQLPNQTAFLCFKTNLLMFKGFLVRFQNKSTSQKYFCRQIVLFIILSIIT